MPQPWNIIESYKDYRELTGKDYYEENIKPQILSSVASNVTSKKDGVSMDKCQACGLSQSNYRTCVEALKLIAATRFPNSLEVYSALLVQTIKIAQDAIAQTHLLTDKNE